MKNTTKQNIIEIINRLKEKNETLSFAESCTGGRIASAFTAISGASSVLNGSCVTYSNEIKSQWLGVDKQIFIDHGAVSKQCVNAMLKGIIQMAKAEHAIAVSGIAGPTGGSEDKPVGTVYLGVNINGNITVEHHLFQGDRESIQAQATEKGISLLKKKL
jgi:nicotinamide-nucleotide amidase